MSSTLLINPSAIEAGLQAAFNAKSQTREPQEAAFERFSKLGFPSRRLEGWKWSDFNAAVRKIEPRDGEAATAIPPSAFSHLDPIEFQIIDGRINLPKGAPPDGVKFGIMDAVATIDALEKNPIALLNVAMTRKALGVEISDGVKLEQPILIRHINNGAGFSFAQTLMRISRGAKARLIETFEGEGAGFYSHLFHMALRDGGEFDRIVLQETGNDRLVHSVCAAKVEEAARFDQTSFSTGARLSRHETHVHFWAPGASAKINSAALLSGARHADFTSEVLHKAENCRARQLHKSVAAGRGRAVFQGKFNVERTAQKTDAKMTANALLISDMAEANHKPELEIYADDVECAHGSTAGALDDEALFYMRQRGLNENQARAMLIEAFLGEVIDAMDDDSLRDVLKSKTAAWLQAAI